MKRTPNIYRRKPQHLPPLPDLHPSVDARMNSLQPPDLILTGKKRLGSPIPKKNIQDRSQIFNGDNKKPMIKIFESEEMSNGNGNLIEDLASKKIFNEENDSVSYENNKNFEFFRCELDKYSHLQTRPQMEKLANKNTNSDASVIRVPNRYITLKPIGQH